MKVAQAGAQIFFWHTTKGNDAVEDFLKEGESQILFYGNKIRMSDKVAEKAWFEAYFAIVKAFKTFICSKKENICSWRG